MGGKKKNTAGFTSIKFTCSEAGEIELCPKDIQHDWLIHYQEGRDYHPPTESVSLRFNCTCGQIHQVELYSY